MTPQRLAQTGEERKSMNLQFQPGRNAYLERRLGNMVQRGACRIVGALRPHYVLITQPQEKGATLALTEGSRCFLRFLHQSEMVGYSVRVERVQLEPFPLVILSDPQDRTAVTVRKVDRVECNIPLVLWPKEDAPVEATAVDLSAGGFQVAIPLYDNQEPLPAFDGIVERYGQEALERYLPEALRQTFVDGFELPVELHLPHGAGQIEKLAGLKTIVRWRQATEENLFLGINLHEPGEKLVVKIQAAVDFQRRFFTQKIEAVR